WMKRLRDERRASTWSRLGERWLSGHQLQRPTSQRANEPTSQRANDELELLQPQLAPLHVQRHLVVAEEVVPDDAAKLETEEDARRAQVQHHERHVLVFDLIEVQVHAGQQERVAIPAGGAVDLERNPPVGVLVEVA